MIKIALGHKSRVGKDTVADYILTKMNGNKISFSGGLYEICGMIQGYYDKRIEKDPKLLQLVGEGLRNICGRDVWARSLLSKVRQLEKNNNQCEIKCIIVSDMRYINEMDALTAEGFVTVDVNRSDRAIDRDPNHPSEVELDGANFDYVIDNSGSVNDLYAIIDDILCEIINKFERSTV